MLVNLLIIAIVLFAGLALYIRSTGTVYWGRTAAGLTTVHDDHHVMAGQIRVLEIEGTYQSATYLDGRWANPVFPYHLLFDRMFDAWPAGDGPASVAILGGGGYAIPKHLVAHHPEVKTIDVIEIDPKIERIARRHFFVNCLEELYQAESSGRLRLHIDDAYDWLKACDRRFDAIANDCFLALEPEASFMTRDGALLVASHLADNGLYLTNVVSALEGPEAAVLYRTIASLRQVFAHIWVYPCSENEPTAKDNNLVIATNNSHHFDGAWEWPTT